MVGVISAPYFRGTHFRGPLRIGMGYEEVDSGCSLASSLQVEP